MEEAYKPIKDFTELIAGQVGHDLVNSLITSCNKHFN